jgi:hypothetical protein
MGLVELGALVALAQVRDVFHPPILRGGGDRGNLQLARPAAA